MKKPDVWICPCYGPMRYDIFKKKAKKSRAKPIAIGVVLALALIVVCNLF